MTLREQAEAIWKAGVAAVDSSTLVRNVIHRVDDELRICGETFAAAALRRIVVVGAGKAGAGMASAVEASLGRDLVATKVSGWVNVPADCVRPLDRIHLHAARPAGFNEPRTEGVEGSEQILKMVASLNEDDLCLALLSGGGSALLPAPISGISLEDKLAVTRFLMHAGATIHELNTVRKRLSRIKGGGLLRAAPAGRMIALIISDVPNDPLDIIASGPTVCDPGTAVDAIAVLERFATRNVPGNLLPDSVWQILQEQARSKEKPVSPSIACRNEVIGNNQTALNAAIEQARRLSFDVRPLGTNREGIAREVGYELADLSLAARDECSKTGICFIGGGEPVVKLAATDKPRRGGRNQEVALAAGCRWGSEDIRRLIVLSGGTDGEDGPTDAAGAGFDVTIRTAAHQQNLDPEQFLAINNSYPFFESCGGLLKTGPTHTNVMDVQIALVSGTGS